MNHEELFDNVQKRTAMYLLDETFAAAVAFVAGYDSANGILVGFREWLIVRLGDFNNLSWPALVGHIAFPEGKWRDRVATAQDNRHAIDTLFDLLREFFVERRQSEGLRRIFEKYSAWLRTQDWFDEKQ